MGSGLASAAADAYNWTPDSARPAVTLYHFF